MKQIINISSNGIKQAIDDLVNENELLQDKIYKQNDKIERINNKLKDIKSQLDYLETYSSKEDVFEDMKRRLYRIEDIVNRK